MTAIEGIQAANVPDELRARPQWVCWKFIEREGRTTKMPVNPRTSSPASSTDPATWSTFTVAAGMMAKAGYAGIGFVFSESDPYYGVDLDDCIGPGGQIVEQAQAIIDTLNTYAEVSPSGRGVKLIGLGRMPEGCRNRTRNVEGFGEIEVYDKARFFTVTGHRLDGVPTKPQDSHGAFQSLCLDLLKQPEPEPAKQAPRPVHDDDAVLLEKIRASGQGAKFDRLWQGSTADHEGDDSRADMALCAMLAWWTGRDEPRMDRLFRQSGLMREKWDQRRGERTYGQRTLAEAIRLCPDCYQPPSEKQWSQIIEQAVQRTGKLEALLNDTIQGKRKPIQWPWKGVHRCTRALIPQTTTILCGSPGASKSFMLLESLAWWHDHGVKVACLMLEDSAAYHLRRAMAQRCHNARLTDDEWIEDNPDIALQEYDAHRAFFESMEKAIHEPPKDAMASVPFVCAWMEKQAEQGARIIAVDPITLADGGEKQFVADKQMIARAKQIAETHNVSIILVTHPKNDVTRPYMDGVAGGKTITRAAQTVLWLEYLDDDEEVTVVDGALRLRVQATVNRKLHILKSRNAAGQGRVIGMNFLKDSLTFSEAGVITK